MAKNPKSKRTNWAAVQNKGRRLARRAEAFRRQGRVAPPPREARASGA